MTENLRRLIAGVSELERVTGLRIAIIGGVAVGAWASPRATQDLDVLVASADLSVVVTNAPAAGLVAVQAEVEQLAQADMTRLRLPDQLVGPVRLDVVAAVHPYYERVLARSRIVKVFDHDVRVACAEDIILLKILADRPQDRADVHAILASQSDLDWDLLHTEADALELSLPDPLMR